MPNVKKTPKTKSKKRIPGDTLKRIRKERLKNIESKKKEMKLVDKWMGEVNIYGKKSKIKIEIFKPKQKNYYICITPCKVSECVFGPFTNTIKDKPVYEKFVKKKGLVKMKTPDYKIAIQYSKRGGHHGSYGTVLRYLFMRLKDESIANKLFKFLSKYSGKVTDKTKKKSGKTTKKVTTKGKTTKGKTTKGKTTKSTKGKTTKKVTTKGKTTKKVTTKGKTTKGKTTKGKTTKGGYGLNTKNYSPLLFEISNNKNNKNVLNNLKITSMGFSPLSGYEPRYEPHKWNLKEHIKSNHNCYSYALNDKHGRRKGKAQPGYYANYPPIDLSEYKCDAIFKRIWKDNPSIYPTLFTNKCNKGYYKAFFTLSPKNHTDYHFYRQDKNGYWSHKPGRTDVTNKDADGKKIINPRNANRNYGSLNYNLPCQYFCLHPKMTRTHSRTQHNR